MSVAEDRVYVDRVCYSWRVSESLAYLKKIVFKTWLDQCALHKDLLLCADMYVWMPFMSPTIIVSK